MACQWMGVQELTITESCGSQKRQCGPLYHAPSTSEESSPRCSGKAAASKLDSIPVLADHLIRLFATCGSLDEANQVFEKVSTPTVHTWCAIIAAHVKHGQCATSFDLYDKMALAGVESNKCVYLTLLKVCSSVMALKQAYAEYGHAKLALQSLLCMQLDGIKPDSTTFVNVLSSYCHAGLVEELKQHIMSMQADHGVEPNAKHYTCMLDLLGQMGLLSEASNLHGVIKPDKVSCISLLTACQRHGNLELGGVCFNEVMSSLAHVGTAQTHW
ncbi:hypothetical protein GOP47_0014853 [Adiantum capillus-veneris]|uniref:Pentatricopeptide repeat-containing protein n=1 Tax=Adiantum capillus-veneris TaxID=13818 RepID=A0A9D4ZEM4_ADICA|nr:hypothetical protein GOP47_0014853 [Adiantum capillus-veneris]